MIKYHGELKDIGDSIDGPGMLEYDDLNSTAQVEEIMSRCPKGTKAEWDTILRDESIPEPAEDAEHLCNKLNKDGSFVVREKFEFNSCWTEQQNSKYQWEYKRYENDKEEYKLNNKFLFNMFENPLKVLYSWAFDGTVHNFRSTFKGNTDQFARCEKVCIGYKSFFQKEKKKVIHTVGRTAKVEWKVDDKFKDGPYTGLFKHGNQDAIMHVTNTIDPKKGFKPSFALKFFRNNNISSDILVLNGGRAKENLNFFAHGMSNMIPMPPKEFFESPENWEEGIPPHQFLKIDAMFSMLGLSESANNDETGRPLNIAKEKDMDGFKPDWTKVSPPFRVFFEPTKEASKACEGAIAEDPYKCFEKLEGLVEKSLYTIWAQFDMDTEWQKIGSIILKSDFKNCPIVDKEIKFVHILSIDEYVRVYMPRWRNQIKDGQAPLKIKVNQQKRVVSAVIKTWKAKRAQVYMKKKQINEAKKIDDPSKRNASLKKLWPEHRALYEQAKALTIKKKKAHQVFRDLTEKVRAVQQFHRAKIDAFRNAWYEGDRSKFVIESVDVIHAKINAADN